MAASSFGALSRAFACRSACSNASLTKAVIVCALATDKFAGNDSEALALGVGRGCAELHDRMMVGLRVPRIECDELWAYIGCKQKRVTRANVAVKGDAVHLCCTGGLPTKAIIGYRTGKRDSENTDLFIRDLRERVLGTPEISTDVLLPIAGKAKKVATAKPAERPSTRQKNVG